MLIERQRAITTCAERGASPTARSTTVYEPEGKFVDSCKSMEAPKEAMVRRCTHWPFGSISSNVALRPMSC